MKLAMPSNPKAAKHGHFHSESRGITEYPSRTTTIQLTSRSGEGLFKGRREAGSEELCGAVGGDDHVVFAADAVVAGNVDAWLVGKGHARLEDGLAAADEIRMLVAVEANAVAKAVGERFVVGAEACASDDGARGIVHGAGEALGPRSVERGILRAA